MSTPNLIAKTYPQVTLYCTNDYCKVLSITYPPSVDDVYVKDIHCPKCTGSVVKGCPTVRITPREHIVKDIDF